ncbi:uncharacterized protein LOC144707561 [Wolffia australiana]
MEVNGVQTLPRTSLSLRAEETESGFRFFVDDDEESFFDLNLEKTINREDYQFQMAFSPSTAAPNSSAIVKPSSPGKANHRHVSTEIGSEDQLKKTEKFLVRFSWSEKLRSSFGAVARKKLLFSASSSGRKGTTKGRFLGCLQLGKKRPVHSRRPAGTVDVEVDDDVVVNTILHAVDFAARSKRWTNAKIVFERNDSVDSAIAHCKLSYTGAGGAAGARN